MKAILMIAKTLMLLVLILLMGNPLFFVAALYFYDKEIFLFIKGVIDYWLSFFKKVEHGY